MGIWAQAIVFVFASVLAQSINGAGKASYYALYSAVFSTSNYQKDVRPAESDSSVTQIHMKLYLLSLVEVNEQDQTMTVSARLDMYWHDKYLAWNYSNHDDIFSMMVPQEKIWIPDVVLGNGVKAQSQLGFAELPVRLTFTGLVEWQPAVVLTTSCAINITYFPFDTQIALVSNTNGESPVPLSLQLCGILFETAMSTDTEVSIVLDDWEPISINEYSQDGQWSLGNVTAKNLTSKLQKGKVEFTFILGRRRVFYLITIILPVIFLCLTSPLLFALPRDEGEKMTIGITILLAFAVYLSIFADLVPKTSIQVSILGVYLTFALGLSAISLVCCIFNLRIHFRDNSTTVGRRTARVIHLMRKLLFMTPLATDHTSLNTITPLEEHSEDTNGSKCDKMVSNPLPIPDERSLTWQEVAETLDWFYYVLFTTINVLLTLICILTLEFGSAFTAP